LSLSGQEADKRFSLRTKPAVYSSVFAKRILKEKEGFLGRNPETGSGESKEREVC